MKKVWEHLEEYTLVVSLVITVAIIFLQVIMRYIFQNSLSWSEELARYIFLWQIWLGASYATRERKHLSVDIVKDLVPKKVKFYIGLSLYTVWFVFCLFLVYQGSVLTMTLIKSNQVSPAMQIPMAIPYASVPVGCALMAIRLLEQIIPFIKSKGGEV